ncbi:MAG: hypothetical protein M1830_002593 [Pleopsidium flavum]|nr:MAG: hypothetical protein M1830_002593 [Pleopsidium flavum]
MAGGKMYHERMAPRPPVEGGAEGSPFRDGALKAFVLINVNAFNTVIALLEILVLSSPLNTHIIGLLIICSVYFVWTGIAHLITGKYVYKLLDPNYKGWKPVVVAVVNMMAMTVTMSMLQLGLHSTREEATVKAEAQRQSVS